MELKRVASGERLAVEVSGDGDPVVLIPGIIGTRDTWRPVADQLARDRRVVLLDLVGFGDSSRPAHIDALWADAQAAAVAEALDSLRVSSATIAAHDFGGPVAAHLLATRPDLVGRLCLCSTNVTADTPIPMPIAAITWPAVGGLFERLLMSRLALAMSIRQAVGETSEPIRIEVGDAAQRRSTRLVFAAALRELSERYRPIETAVRARGAPMLVLWGDRDPFFSVEQGRRTAAMAGAEFRLFKGAGHFLPVERPDAVAAELVAFGSAARAVA